MCALCFWEEFVTCGAEEYAYTRTHHTHRCTRRVCVHTDTSHTQIHEGGQDSTPTRSDFHTKRHRHRYRHRHRHRPRHRHRHSHRHRHRYRHRHRHRYRHRHRCRNANRNKETQKKTQRKRPRDPERDAHHTQRNREKGTKIRYAPRRYKGLGFRVWGLGFGV